MVGSSFGAGVGSIDGSDVASLYSADGRTAGGPHITHSPEPPVHVVNPSLVVNREHKNFIQALRTALDTSQLQQLSTNVEQKYFGLVGMVSTN